MKKKLLGVVILLGVLALAGWALGTLTSGTARDIGQLLALAVLSMLVGVALSLYILVVLENIPRFSQTTLRDDQRLLGLLTWPLLSIFAAIIVNESVGRILRQFLFGLSNSRPNLVSAAASFLVVLFVITLLGGVVYMGRKVKEGSYEVPNILRHFTKKELSVLAAFALLLGVADWFFDVWPTRTMLTLHSAKYIVFAVAVPLFILSVGVGIFVLLHLVPFVRDLDYEKPANRVLRFFLIIGGTVVGVVPGRWFERLLSGIFFGYSHYHLVRVVTWQEVLAVAVLIGVIGSLFLLYQERRSFLVFSGIAVAIIWSFVYTTMPFVDSMHTQWYELLVNTRGFNWPKNKEKIALIRSNRSLEKTDLKSLLEIVCRSKPVVVGVCMPVLGIDSAFVASLDIDRVVFGGSRLGYPNWKRELFTVITASQADVSSYEVLSPPRVKQRLLRGALTASSRVGIDQSPDIYYQPLFSGDGAGGYDESSVDFGVRIVTRYLDGAQSPSPANRAHRINATTVGLGNLTIPVTTNNRTLINPYARPAAQTIFVTPRSQQQEWWTRSLSFNLLGWYYFIDPEHQDRLYYTGYSFPESDLGSQLAKAQRVEGIKELEGKIVLVTAFPEQWGYKPELDEKYASIIQNILGQDYVTELPSWSVGVILIAALILLGWLFERRTPLRAFSVGTITLVLLFFVAIVIFSLNNSIVPVDVVVPPLVLYLLIAWPAEGARERRQLFEQRASLEGELHAAHDMQMALMPKEDPTVKGFDISGICRPAEEVGGDYYDYVWLDDHQNKLGIAIADVSGKAMKAAITAVMTSGMIYREIGTDNSPRSILRKINRPMYLKTERNVFTALSFAVIDIRKRSLRFSNAGQTQPILYRNKKLSYIKVKGAHLPLGVMKDLSYAEVTMQLKSGDLLLLYTDGLTEATNSKNEILGFEEVEKEIARKAEQPAKEIVRSLTDLVDRFTEGSEQHDDMTVVAIKIL